MSTNQNQPLTFLELAEQIFNLGESARMLLDSEDLDLSKQRKTSDNYETELIQVAATALAALTDLRLQKGLTEEQIQTEFFESVVQERVRQDRKFGSMPRKVDPYLWIAVLMEEISETSSEILK